MNLRDGSPCRNQIAEPSARCSVRRKFVHRSTEENLKTRQQRLEQCRLVVRGITFKQRVVHRHFLHANYIEIGHGARCVNHACDIHNSIESAEPLDIPRNDLHLIPARMNDCTNCLWNSKNASKSGAAVSNVAAVMMDQSMP